MEECDSHGIILAKSSQQKQNPFRDDIIIEKK
jgi:hypothetical protein